jgi:eukaryotic-like serine/threonine-protein kinase
VSPERWRQIESVFNDAADLPAGQRAALLECICAGDLELRREVEDLLSASSLSLIESAIDATSDDMAAGAADDSMVGNRIGAYLIVALVGRGGMGAVYRAVRDDDEFRQQVAIKVVPRLLASPEAVARFRSERQILANLDHPNIARLLDGGTADGIPFLVMEYVEGVPITQHANERDLSIAQRLELMRSVCGAVQYAHQNLIVHRDLKPANILVTADGNVKLLDFGVAKLLDPENAGTTNTSAMILTPDYASPEQVRGEAVTTASDVYSLGVVFYEILAGVRPYQISSTNPSEMQRVVCLTEPSAPSECTNLPMRLRRQLSGDLDNIVLMAMRKEAARRYGSAEQLSSDIQRHLDGRPVMARRDTLTYRCGKFIRRNRWALAAGVLIAGILVTATVTAVREARDAQHRFDQLRGFARTILVDLDAQLRDIPGTVKARQVLIAEVDEYLKRVVSENGADDAALAAEFATTYLRMGEMQGATPEALESLKMAAG